MVYRFNLGPTASFFGSFLSHLTSPSDHWSNKNAQFVPYWPRKLSCPGCVAVLAVPTCIRDTPSSDALIYWTKKNLKKRSFAFEQQHTPGLLKLKYAAVPQRRDWRTDFVAELRILSHYSTHCGIYFLYIFIINIYGTSTLNVVSL